MSRFIRTHGPLIGMAIVLSAAMVFWPAQAGAQTEITAMQVATPVAPPTETQTSSADSLDLQQRTLVLGRPTGASVQATTSPETQQLRSTTLVQILGVTSQALQVWMSATDTEEESPYAEYYAFGKRIFSENFSFQQQDFLQASVGLAPVEVRIPVYTYPVGPLLLQVGAGVRFQAELNGQLIPSLILNDLKSSTALLQLTGQAMGQGFLEGYGSLIAVRAGVGGEVDLLDGQLQLKTTFFFNGKTPQNDFSAVVTFLKGRFYAFADYYQVLKHRWKRYWNYTLFDWKGLCYATGSLSCEG